LSRRAGTDVPPRALRPPPQPVLRVVREQNERRRKAPGGQQPGKMTAQQPAADASAAAAQLMSKLLGEEGSGGVEITARVPSSMTRKHRGDCSRMITRSSIARHGSDGRLTGSSACSSATIAGTLSRPRRRCMVVAPDQRAIGAGVPRARGDEFLSARELTSCVVRPARRQRGEKPVDGKCSRGWSGEAAAPLTRRAASCRGARGGGTWCVGVAGRARDRGQLLSSDLVRL